MCCNFRFTSNGLSIRAMSYPTLTFSSINVNTLNISTFREGACKTVEKLVVIRKRNSDIILMCDCRLGKGIDKIKKVLLNGKGILYDLYSNSTRGERGVCIAINRARDVEVLEIIKDEVDENFLMLRCRVENMEMLIGAVYGPNVNNREFYRRLKDKSMSYNLPTILGGDFNTVLDDRVGEENMDLEDRYNIPQKENGKFIREWIGEGRICEPFRHKYPMVRKMSYIPFRKKRRVGDQWVEANYGKSRLNYGYNGKHAFYFLCG